MKKVTVIIADQNLLPLINALNGIATKFTVDEYIASGAEPQHKKAVTATLPNGHGREVEVTYSPAKTEHRIEAIKQAVERKASKRSKERYPRISTEQAREIFFRHASKGPYRVADLPAWATVEKVNKSALITVHTAAVTAGEVKGKPSDPTRHWCPYDYSVVKVTKETKRELAEHFNK